MNRDDLIEGMFEELSLTDIKEMLSENPLFRGYFQGYLAERHLKNQLMSLPEISQISKIPDFENRKGDLLIVYNEKPLTIEVKSMSSLDIKEDILCGGYSGRVHVKNTDSEEVDGGKTVAPKRGTFDILAICTFPIHKKWEYLFIHNKYLPSSKLFPDRIQPNIFINTCNTPCLHKDLRRVLSDIN